MHNSPPPPGLNNHTKGAMAPSRDWSIVRGKTIKAKALLTHLIDDLLYASFIYFWRKTVHAKGSESNGEGISPAIRPLDARSRKRKRLKDKTK